MLEKFVQRLKITKPVYDQSQIWECMHKSVRTHTCTDVYTCIHTYILSTHMNAYIHIYTYTTHMYASVHIYVCMYACRVLKSKCNLKKEKGSKIKQNNILISKNQALQMLCLKHHVFKTSWIRN